MTAVNYDSILDQLRAAKFVGRGVDDVLQIGRFVRCKIDGDREHRGWYKLHDVVTDTGDHLLIGSYGIWRGNDQGATKFAIEKSAITAEQSKMLQARLRADRKAADQARADEARKAAGRAARAWAKCSEIGESDYLDRKAIVRNGCRFSPSGTLVIPMLDTAGIIHGLQIIRNRKDKRASRQLEKEYWPRGLSKKGHFFLMGVPTSIVLVAEGYATGATLHVATGLPVAVAFDAGNLQPVAEALHARYRTARILICADDDALAKCRECGARLILEHSQSACSACGKDHRCSNAGVTAASTAAVAVGGAFAVPVFSDEASRRAQFLERGIKQTDFNDLQHAPADGLIAVRDQIASRLTELGWDRSKARGPTAPVDGGKLTLRPIDSLDELIERFSLVYGQSGTVFDAIEHVLVSTSDMRDACLTRYVHRAWSEHPERKIVRAESVGFDPGEKDPTISCNLWAGWPTTPQSGGCTKLLDLLGYICSVEGNSQPMVDWVLKWLAYPIQHAGAKMKSALVAHGPQGTGKNLFFEAVMSIYGKYGRMIDQAAIEDKFNDWASARLFLIADEVVARSDLYHVKNKLKAFITGDWIRINPKNLAARDERNHVNLVFLSNESMPVVIEEDDRRHAVIYTPPPLPKAMYLDIARELEAGGVAALHHHLLHLDLGDFNEHTPPPMSDAKLTLIELARDSTSRFLFEISDGDIPGIKAMPALSVDVYSVYRTWCSRNGHRAAPLPKLLNVLHRKHCIKIERKRYVDKFGKQHGPHSIIMLGNLSETASPPGESEPVWLGKSIAAFANQLDDMTARAAA